MPYRFRIRPSLYNVVKDKAVSRHFEWVIPSTILWPGIKESQTIFRDKWSHPTILILSRDKASVPSCFSLVKRHGRVFDRDPLYDPDVFCGHLLHWWCLVRQRLVTFIGHVFFFKNKFLYNFFLRSFFVEYSTICRPSWPEWGRLFFLVGLRFILFFELFHVLFQPK